MICDRCGAELAPGQLKYLVTIHVTADFDGVLPGTGSREDLEAFMRQMDQEDPVRLERDVHQSHGHLLCPTCKDAFLRTPLGPVEPGDDTEEGGRMH